MSQPVVSWSNLSFGLNMTTTGPVTIKNAELEDLCKLLSPGTSIIKTFLLLFPNQNFMACNHFVVFLTGMSPASFSFHSFQTTFPVYFSGIQTMVIVKEPLRPYFEILMLIKYLLLFILYPQYCSPDSFSTLHNTLNIKPFTKKTLFTLFTPQHT